jgi:DNA-binding transcriptional LysR family regulator
MAGSLSAAARRLNAPLKIVGRKASKLEPHLRTKLFNRPSGAELGASAFVRT